MISSNAAGAGPTILSAGHHISFAVDRLRNQGDDEAIPAHLNR
jgi:hypothetical protein